MHLLAYSPSTHSPIHHLSKHLSIQPPIHPPSAPSNHPPIFTSVNLYHPPIHLPIHHPVLPPPTLITGALTTCLPEHELFRKLASSTGPLFSTKSQFSQFKTDSQMQKGIKSTRSRTVQSQISMMHQIMFWEEIWMDRGLVLFVGSKKGRAGGKAGYM